MLKVNIDTSLPEADHIIVNFQLPLAVFRFPAIPCRNLPYCSTPRGPVLHSTCPVHYTRPDRVVSVADLPKTREYQQPGHIRQRNSCTV